MNAATLPGLVGNVLVMPDGHEGYGFPIGGVMAFDAENGIVSPGAVGFDINCLHPDSRIYDENGAWHSIKNVNCTTLKPTSFDTENKILLNTSALLLLEKKGCKSVIKITTEFGKEILVTKDHPLLTKNGMINAGMLSKGDNLISSGLGGIEYKQPLRNPLLTEEMIEEVLKTFRITDKGNGKIQVMNFLRKLGLNQIDTLHSKLPILIKLIAFVMGDGTIPNRTSGGWYTTFYGKNKDLQKIKGDVESLGFKCRLNIRKRHHKINTAYGTSEFDYEENALSVTSTAFCAILVGLGAPYGNKATKAYHVPEWIINAEDWQKRLFLASFFRLHLSKPQTHNGYNFQMPSFSSSKLIALNDNNVAFLLDIKKMLGSLGIQTSNPSVVEGYKYFGVRGESIGFRLSILSNTPNLKRFFSTVGYVYNKNKERLASLSSLYLTYLETKRNQRNLIRQQAIQMHLYKNTTREIISALADENAGASFIKHSLWGREGNARINGSLKFDQFIKAYEIGESGLVYDKIIQIEETPYNGSVFDITVENKHHNFICNEIVVSNCGVE